MHSPVYFFILVVIHLVHALYLNIVFFLQVASDEEQGDEEPPLAKRTAGMDACVFNRSLAVAEASNNDSDEETDSA